ncbi:MAG: CDP-alcohol phosphatidyltransferase family protein [Actinomycetota bacterium]|nr:CDP-alcohol phosphatidyltransferase family protein [Actinomycetota bacterium]
MSGFEADARGAKKRDYWFTVLLTDPVAVPLTTFLAKRRLLTPNQVTIFALVFGLSVGVFFASGERWGLIAGAVAFYLAFVFDCVDGKLARATGITSDKGQALDALADGGRRASASLGLGIALWRTDGFYDCAREGLCTGLSDLGEHVALLVLIVYVVLAYYFLEISGADKGDPPGGVRGRWAEALARRRLLPNPGMPDVQAIVFIFGPLLGLVVPALAVGIAMVSVAILLTVRRRLR